MTAPVNVDEALVERARELVRTQGGIPSRNQLKLGLRVGADKAAAVRERLLAEARERRGNGRRAMRRLSHRATETRLRRRSAGGLRAVLPVPVSPIVGPLTPRPLPQASTPPSPVKTTPAAPVASGPDLVPAKRLVTWPVLVVAAGAFVAIWAGWVALGKLTGFGKVNLLPGFWSGWTVDTAITLPLGMEAYAAYAFYVWLHPQAPRRARSFAFWSSMAGVVLGMGGQAAFHLMTAAHMTKAPWQITTVVSCLPVAVFGLSAALVHLVRADGADR